MSSILSSSTTLLDASTLGPAYRQTILERARGLFYDSDMPTIPILHRHPTSIP